MIYVIFMGNMQQEKRHQKTQVLTHDFEKNEKKHHKKNKSWPKNKTPEKNIKNKTLAKRNTRKKKL